MTLTVCVLTEKTECEDVKQIEFFKEITRRGAFVSTLNRIIITVLLKRTNSLIKFINKIWHWKVEKIVSSLTNFIKYFWINRKKYV